MKGSDIQGEKRERERQRKIQGEEECETKTHRQKNRPICEEVE